MDFFIISFIESLLLFQFISEEEKNNNNKKQSTRRNVNGARLWKL